MDLFCKKFKQWTFEISLNTNSILLLDCLNDKKTLLEVISIALIGKGFKLFWPKLTKVQKKKDFYQSLLDFKVTTMKTLKLIVNLLIIKIILLFRFFLTRSNRPNHQVKSFWNILMALIKLRWY